MAGQQEEHKRTWTEEFEVAGNELIGRVKSLVAEGNVRQLRIKAAGGEVYFETPLTVGVIAGGAVALAAPWLAILGALAALVARVKVEIVREGKPSASDARKRAAAKRRPTASRAPATEGPQGRGKAAKSRRSR
jgi:hypothetical protein